MSLADVLRAGPAYALSSDPATMLWATKIGWHVGQRTSAGSTACYLMSKQARVSLPHAESSWSMFDGKAFVAGERRRV